MRVYLDNCCYNRPFDDQGQLKVRLETEAKMEVPGDYTKWRENNLYVGATLHDVAERARSAGERYCLRTGSMACA